MTQYNPHQGQYQAPAPKKRRKWPFIVGGVLLLLVVIGVANGGNTSSTPTAAPQSPAQALDTLEDIAGAGTVTLSVEGSGKAMVSYLHDGGQSQETVSLPWTKDVEAGFIGSLTAQRKSGNSGSIACKITEGSEVRAESTSDGPYAVVSCAG